jgi:hypothetical protein
MAHTHLHRRTLTILTIAAGVAVALSTTAAPASAATFYISPAGSMVEQPLPTNWSCVLQRASTDNAQATACRAASSTAQSTTRLVVRPNPDQQAFSGPPRHIAHHIAKPPAVEPNPDEQAAIAGASNPRVTIVRVTTAKRGFDWSDAGIGAAGSFALALIALGGVLAISRTRARRSTV